MALQNRRQRPGVEDTESSTIFNGHGDARVIAVSVSIAAMTTTSHFQYGRTRRTEKRSAGYG